MKQTTKKKTEQTEVGEVTYDVTECAFCGKTDQVDEMVSWQGTSVKEYYETLKKVKFSEETYDQAYVCSDCHSQSVGGKEGAAKETVMTEYGEVSYDVEECDRCSSKHKPVNLTTWFGGDVKSVNKRHSSVTVHLSEYRPDRLRLCDDCAPYSEESFLEMLDEDEQVLLFIFGATLLFILFIMFM